MESIRLAQRKRSILKPLSSIGLRVSGAATPLRNTLYMDHKAEEGGFWAEVPSGPGCASQGETMEELRFNLREVIEGCLPVPVEALSEHADD